MIQGAAANSSVPEAGPVGWNEHPRIPADCEASWDSLRSSQPTEDERIAECLGVGLPPEAEEHLRLAGQNYHRDEVALQHLQAAWELAPGHAAVYIGKYRFYFYKNRLADALAVGTECLAKAAVDNGMPSNWRDAKPEDADFGNFAAILPRFFLFTLKGYAYLNLRLGNLEEGRAAAEKLLDLDPTDKVGAKVLLEVLQRKANGDDED